MKIQTNQQQKTQGKTTNHANDKDKKQRNNRITKTYVWDGYIIPQKINGEQPNKLSYATVLSSRKAPLLSPKLPKHVSPLAYHVFLLMKPMMI
jgi:hypothetical protein